MGRGNRVIHGFLAVGTLVWSATVQGSVLPTFGGLVQSNFPLNGTFSLVSANQYQRQDYNAIGAMVFTNGAGLDPNTGEYRYFVDPGDTFKWLWRDTATGEVIGEKLTTFLGGENSCWTLGGCGEYFFFRAYYPLQCLEEDIQVQVETYYNNVMFGSETFKPTRFHPRIYEVQFPENLSPKQTTSAEGEAGEIVAIIEDDLGCALPIRDAKVRFTATVIGGTNGHGYMQSGEFGTGKFESLGYSSKLDPDGDTEGTVIEGYSDENGEYRANYRAYDHALMENIQVEAERPSEGDSEAIEAAPTSVNVKLSIPGLVGLTESTGAFSFHDGGGCPHTEPVNYMTPSARIRLQIAATFFFEDAGAYLSINDASLPWGGYVANYKSGGRDAKCHGSHRKGVDVDINEYSRLTQERSDSAPLGPSLYSGEIELNGRSYMLLEYLTSVMSSVRGVKLVEQNSIHYRFPG